MMLQISTRVSGGIAIVDCRGRIILGDETAALRDLVNDLMNERSQVVLDLTGVTHIDSNGIGMLAALHISASKRGAVIKLAGLGERVKSVMEITKLATIFEVYPTVEQAAASFEISIPQQMVG